MKSISVSLDPAPTSPLSLQFGVVYEPRIATPPFAGFAASEVSPGVFEVWGYDDAGGGAVLFRGALPETYYRFASHLRMDVEP